MKSIIDTSIIVKWFLQDEEDLETAFRIFYDFKNGHLSLIEPYLFQTEFTNVMTTALKRGRIRNENAILAMKKFSELPIVYYDLENDLEEIFTIATGYDLSAYDSTYVCLAKKLRIPFYTADKKLLTQVKTLSSSLKSISDY